MQLLVWISFAVFVVTFILSDIGGGNKFLSALKNIGHVAIVVLGVVTVLQGGASIPLGIVAIFVSGVFLLESTFKWISQERNIKKLEKEERVRRYVWEIEEDKVRWKHFLDQAIVWAEYSPHDANAIKDNYEKWQQRDLIEKYLLANGIPKDK